MVVQFTQYDGVSNGQTVGEGDVWVFTDGRVRKGRWIRPDREQPAHYVDANGLPILLRPGRTWVELLPADYAVDVEYAPVRRHHHAATHHARSDDDHEAQEGEVARAGSLL